MKTAMITGVLGQDGSYLAELLIQQHYRVIGLQRSPLTREYSLDDDRYRNIHSIKDHPQFTLEYADMADPSTLWRVVSHYKPDEVYNLAAQSHVNLSFNSSETTAEINALGTLNLLNILLELAPQVKFFQASSSDMYGENPDTVLNETSECLPNTPYGASKLFAHNMTRIYRDKYNLFTSTAILFNHESPRRGENFATQKIARNAAKIKLGLETQLRLGNLEVKRDWGHAKDTVQAIWKIMQHSKADDFVVATGKCHSLKSFVDFIFNHAGLSVDKHVVIDPEFYRSYDKMAVQGDPKKINTELDWHATHSFQETAIEMYESALHELQKNA